MSLSHMAGLCNKSAAGPTAGSMHASTMGVGYGPHMMETSGGPAKAQVFHHDTHRVAGDRPGPRVGS